MADPYHIDLEQFSLDRFRQTLETGDLLPGRRVLAEDIPERFQALESAGIHNLADLSVALKSRRKMEQFAELSGLPLDYLVILRREVNSYLPNPVNLRDIPGVEPALLEGLAAAGVTHTKHLFAHARTRRDRAELAEQVGMSADDLLQLVKMADLARINGVGPVFIRMLHDAGIDTVERLLEAEPAELLARLHAINDEREYTKIMPTLKDMQYIRDWAQMLPLAVEY